ncbi:response regulator [Siccirubricoccus sp. KC 17139]|uniref:Response regulator n=1 Tax=Siccirubricoccus soli TaxID=2899147 RepID=A0ABT1CZK0_9PROT|nr:response regulator [Siccirubricoccus soli]MCO6415100.1 response regulator [Siccirubricoccus soli]MCP2681231.1 response regulator [Siccirubricoccus soli]
MSPQILVVDDETDMEALFRQQFRRELRAGRFELAFASSGSRALEILSAPAGNDIILLLSDINMPGMSGLELLSSTKAARPDLPVIIITAYGDAETQRRSLASGADGLLPKPIDFCALRADVARRLERREECP